MTVAERCLHPGCTGTIDEGYCDHCGMAPIATGRSQTRVNGTVRQTTLDGHGRPSNVDTRQPRPPRRRHGRHPARSGA